MTPRWTPAGGPWRRRSRSKRAPPSPPWPAGRCARCSRRGSTAPWAVLRPQQRSSACARAPDLVAAVSSWPSATRGEAAQAAAEIALSQGACAQARAFAADARAASEEGVEPDRCLALAMDASESAGRARDAESPGRRAVAQLGPQPLPRPRRPAGGARPGRRRPRAPARSSPRCAPTRRQGRSASPPASSCAPCSIPTARGTARWWRRWSWRGQAPRRRERCRCGARWRWRGLDAPAGLAALDALPPGLAADPAVAPMRARAAARQEDSLALVIQRAVARAGLGDPAGARAMLAPLARTAPAALVALLSLPGCDPRDFRGAPAARDEAAAISLASALADAGDGEDAYATAAPLLAATPASPARAVAASPSAPPPAPIAEERRRPARAAVHPAGRRPARPWPGVVRRGPGPPGPWPGCGYGLGAGGAQPARSPSLAGRGGLARGQGAGRRRRRCRRARAARGRGQLGRRRGGALPLPLPARPGPGATGRPPGRTANRRFAHWPG